MTVLAFVFQQYNLACFASVTTEMHNIGFTAKKMSLHISNTNCPCWLKANLSPN